MEMRAKSPTTKGASEWFTGDVFVDPAVAVFGVLVATFDRRGHPAASPR